jgi:hypothetical protein
MPTVMIKTSQVSKTCEVCLADNRALNSRWPAADPEDGTAETLRKPEITEIRSCSADGRVGSPLSPPLSYRQRVFPAIIHLNA